MKNDESNFVGKTAILSGEIIEHLKTSSKREWVTIRLPNKQLVTIAIENCKIIYSN